MLGADRAPRLP